MLRSGLFALPPLDFGDHSMTQMLVNPSPVSSSTPRVKRRSVDREKQRWTLLSAAILTLALVLTAVLAGSLNDGEDSEQSVEPSIEVTA